MPTVNQSEPAHQNEVIDISQWEPDEEHHNYPVGARSKELRYSPESGIDPVCISNHRYLFKHSWARHPEQYWAEIIAYRVSLLMNLKVPPSYAAIDSENNIDGSLTEWFLGSEDAGNVKYVAGGDFMQIFVADFDREKGKKHNLTSVITFCRLLSQNSPISFQSDWAKYWAECFLFDSVIGNTDRHQDNWGLLATRTQDSAVSLRFTPYFDNGTSLSHEITPERQARMLKDPELMTRYIHRGAHHMRAKIGSERIPHTRFIEELPFFDRVLTESLLQKLSFTAAEVDAQLEPLTKIDTLHPLLEARAEFVSALLCRRRDILIDTIKGQTK